jgi:hypothetical protein
MHTRSQGRTQTAQAVLLLPLLMLVLVAAFAAAAAAKVLQVRFRTLIKLGTLQQGDHDSRYWQVDPTLCSGQVVLPQCQSALLLLLLLVHFRSTLISCNDTATLTI